MPNSTPNIRFRVDFSAGCSVGIGKIQLLEAIGRSGSLSSAARALRMSYRRSWLLLDDLNGSFDQPVASASVGGRGGGGVALTEFGQRLVDDYRAVESVIQALVASRLRHVISHVGDHRQTARIRATSLTKTSSTRGKRTAARRRNV